MQTPVAYLFKRDFRSSLRLNFTHYLMRELTGYLTHPRIPVNKPDMRIADVGAGTGVWACEVASMLKSGARVDAFDISNQQFPAQVFRPLNLRLHVHNYFQAYESSFVGQFDLVNMRFLMCDVNDSNAQSLLRNQLSLAKPGCWFQWFEPLPHNTCIRTEGAAPDAPTDASERLVQVWHGLQATRTNGYVTIRNEVSAGFELSLTTSLFTFCASWIENMKHMFEEVGLQGIEQVEYNWPGHLRPLWAQSLMATAADTVPEGEIWNSDGKGVTQDFIESLQLEIAQGVAVDTPFLCTIGRKKA